MVNPVPEGMHTLTVQLNIDGADRAIEWYQRAFGAELLARAADPSGKKVWHASLRIGTSVLFVNDTFPEMGATGSATTVWIYTDEVDRWWQRAVDAGAKPAMPVADMFWGDRMGLVIDPFGNRWNLAQHVKDLTPAELKAAQDAFLAQVPK